MLTCIVNPHVKKALPFKQFYETLLGPEEVKRRRGEEHREIVRDRRRKSLKGKRR